MTNTLTWLLVDDDAEDREIFDLALQKTGTSLRLLEAGNGKKALELLDSLPDCELPQLIFLDLNMPQLSGKDCLKSIKSSGRFHKIPVVIYSTSSSPQDMQETLALGAYRFITKPTDISFLIQLLKSFIEEQHPVLS